MPCCCPARRSASGGGVLALVLVLLLLLRVVLLLIMRLLLLLQVKRRLLLCKVASTSTTNSLLLLLLRKGSGFWARAGAVDLAPLPGDEVLGAAGELCFFFRRRCREKVRRGKEKDKKRVNKRTKQRHFPSSCVLLSPNFPPPLRVTAARVGSEKEDEERTQKSRALALSVAPSHSRSLSISFAARKSKLGSLLPLAFLTAAVPRQRG